MNGDDARSISIEAVSYGKARPLPPALNAAVILLPFVLALVVLFRTYDAGLFFLAFGIGLVPLVALGTSAWRRDRVTRKRLRAAGVGASARITAIRAVPNSYDDEIYEVEYEYEVDGVRRDGSRSNVRHRLEVGDRIDVLYDPDDPNVSGWLIS
jgi:hypothetical protein